MSGNTTSLYGSGTSSNTASTNFTTLYSNGNVTVPTNAGYGNANVAGFLAEGSDTGGNVIGNITATGNIQTTGYFVGNFAGNISGNLIVPGANTQILYNNNGNAGASNNFKFNAANSLMTLTGTANISGNVNSGNIVNTGSITTGGNINTAGVISATGNVKGYYFIGNGSQLTGIVTNTYGNGNVTSLLANFGSNTISTTGNISGGYFRGNGSLLTGITADYGNSNVTTLLANFGSNAISTTGNVTAGYVIGNGSKLTNITAGNITGQVANALVAGTVYTAAQPNITSVGTLTSLTVSGNVSGGNIATAGQVSAAGNITAANFIGNITGNVGGGSISVAGNITGGNLLTSGLISAGGNITGGNVSGATVTATTVNTTTASASGNITGGNVLTGGLISSTGNITGGNLSGATITATTVNTATASASGNITGGNVLTGGAVSATGNITGGNVNTTGVFATTVSTSGNVTSGNIVNNGTISSTGNITAPYFFGNVSGNIVGNIDAAGSNTQVQFNDTGDILGASAGFTFDKTANLLTVSGNVQGGNIRTAGLVSATGTITSAANVIGGNLTTAGQVSATANITGGNVIGATDVSAVANIAGGNVVVPNNYRYRGDFSSLPAAGRTMFQTTSLSTTAPSFITAMPGPNHTNTGQGAGVGAYASNDIGNSASAGIYSYPTEARVQSLSTGTATAQPMTFYIGGPGEVGRATTAGNWGLGNVAPTDRLAVSGNAYVSGNVTGGNILTAGSVSATGNITGNNIIGNFVLTSLSITGNITGGNILTAGLVSATGTITSAANVIGGNITTAGQVSATANITGGNLLTAGLISSTGNITSAANIAGGNISVTGTVRGATVSATANVIGGNITTVGQVSATGNISTAANIVTTGAQGNITGANYVSANYFVGNGSLLTGITTTYSNTNVATFLANFGSNVISTTGNVTAGYFVGNGSTLTSITGANITGTVANATYALNANAATFAGTVTTAAQPNITSVGILTALNTSGAISATGNIQGNVFIGNAAGLTDIPAGNIVGAYGNANVANFLANYGSNTISTTGNVDSGNLTATNVYTAGVVSATGNVRGGNINTAGAVSASGNVLGGNVLTGVVQATSSAGGALKNASGTTQASWGAGGGDNFAISVSTNINGANAQVDISPTGNLGHVHINPTGLGSVEIAPTTTGSINNMVIGNVTPAAISATTVSATGNITGAYFIGNGSQLTGLPAGYSNADVSTYLASGTNTANIITTGNISGGNLVTGGLISAAGNITGNYFLGNGSALTGITVAAGGSNTQIQYNDAGVNAGNAAMTFNNTNGNIGLGNLIVGSTATSGAGAPQRINTINAFAGGYANTTNWQDSQIIIGNGLYGNLNQAASSASGARGAKFLVWDSANVTDTANAGVRLNASSAQEQIILNGNLTSVNTFFRAQALTLGIGGGPSGNTLDSRAFNQGGQGLGAVAAISGSLNVGNQSSSIPLGNTTISGGSGVYGQIFNYNGSQISNAVGINFQVQNSGNIPNIAGVGLQFTGNNTLATQSQNVFGVYMPGSSASSYFSGISNMNKFRGANNYYFLYNEDAVAQTQLGTLRSYNEFRYDTATSGTIAIDKSNAQVQYIAPTGNVTISGYSNMVTSLSDGTNTDQEIDTLTIIVQQGATPYTVTLPTGSTYLYAGNVSTVPAVANGQSIITVKASNNAGTVNYFTTVVSDQTTQEPAGGANTQIQYNNAGLLAGNALMTFDNTTGNVTIANTIIGTASGSYNRLNTTTPWSGGNTSVSVLQPGQLVIGNAFFGNANPANNPVAAVRGAKVLIWDSANVVEPVGGGVRYNGLTVFPQISMSNATNNNTLLRGGVGGLNIGGGPSANTLSYNTGQGAGAVVGWNQALFVGQPNATVSLGNVTLATGTASYSQMTTYAGSNIGNAYSTLAQQNNSGNITNQIGLGAWFLGTPTTTPTNVFGVYMPGTSTTYGISNSNGTRAATNYYFLRNDDAVAQNQLGSLRAYHTYQYPTATSGTINIDKNNGQTQFINVTGNVTIGDFQNFVTTANDSINNDTQSDTVTLIIEQGATPYTVTMPTGNASIRYASGNSTVPSTANSTVTIQIQAYRNAANAAAYITTISPDFT